ncbi:hypothetical protein U5N54_20955, partial [Bacillus paralicheniformis]|uniref:hypothetical protein n=1 Tax=Bacillus paralicheniformis TaxID=1648923 RepID=UPI00397D32FF
LTTAAVIAKDCDEVNFAMLTSAVLAAIRNADDTPICECNTISLSPSHLPMPQIPDGLAIPSLKE